MEMTFVHNFLDDLLRPMYIILVQNALSISASSPLAVHSLVTNLEPHHTLVSVPLYGHK